MARGFVWSQTHSGDFLSCFCVLDWWVAVWPFGSLTNVTPCTDIIDFIVDYFEQTFMRREGGLESRGKYDMISEPEPRSRSLVQPPPPDHRATLNLVEFPAAKAPKIAPL